MADWPHPIPGVSVLLFRDSSAEELLLVRRGREPLRGHWALPGGKLEAGERVAEAARREMQEETGLRVELPAHPVLTTLDRIQRDEGGVLRFHYLLVVVVAHRADQAEPLPADDAADCRWWPVARFAEAQPQVDDLLPLVALARQRLAGGR